MLAAGNVALRKSSYQRGQHRGLSASLAVDGNTDLNSDNCAHPFTGVGGLPVWWYVDLGQSYRITQVVLYNTAGIGAASKCQ